MMLEEKRQREQEFLTTEPQEPEMRQRLECESNEPPQNGFSPDSLVCVQQNAAANRDQIKHDLVAIGIHFGESFRGLLNTVTLMF